MIPPVTVSPPISHTKIKKESKVLQLLHSPFLRIIGHWMSVLLKWVIIIGWYIIGTVNIIRLMIYSPYKIKLTLGVLLITYLQCVIILIVNADLDTILNA